MHVHVFSIDILPFDGFVCSGGGLRSWQIINGLRQLGAEVTYSMPVGAPLVKQQWDRLTAEQRENCYTHDKGNQLIDIINKFKPDATLVLWPLGFWTTNSFKDGMLTVYDINGFQNIESVGFQDSVAHFDWETRRFLQKISCADILITGSSEQRAYWGGLLGYHRNSVAPTEMLDVPFCLDRAVLDATAAKRYDPGAPLFFCTGTFLPWNGPQGHLIKLAQLIAAAGRGELLVVGRPILSEPYAGEVLRELEAVSRFPFARNVPGMPFAEMVETIGRRGVAIDLHLPTFERQFALPVRTLTYLGLGMPVIFNNYSTLAAQVERYGAGFCIDPSKDQEFEKVIEKILAQPDDGELAQMSDRAVRLVHENFYGDAAMRRLFGRMEEKLASIKGARKSARPAQKTAVLGGYAPVRNLLSPFIRKPLLPRVLVISDEFENLLELRVHLPFRTMRQQQLIDDYIVMAHGKLVKRDDSSPALRDIDVVWVQRRPSTSGLFVVNMFGENFALDIDDNLLISPAYRPPFTSEWTSVARGLLRSAGTVATTGPRVVDSLQRSAGATFEDKVVIAPNMTGSVHKKNIVHPTALLLACSDLLPLTSSKEPFLRAIRRFTELRELPLLYVGVPLDELRGNAYKVHHINTLPYQRYLNLLRSEPLVAVVPLEGHGDPLTDDFICGKSDIKMVEYGAASIPAVYSRVAPYSDSSLQVGPLVDFSDASAIIHALDMVFTDATRQARLAHDSVREQRLASDVVGQWYKAVERARLSHPVSLETLQTQADRYVSYLAGGAATPAQFDEASYASAYPDAVEWAESGGHSLYDHYLKYGVPEGRRWHVGDPGTSIEETAVRAKELVLTIDRELTLVAARVEAALRE